MSTEAEPVSHAVVYYEGRVQGVGFRWQTRQAAQQFEVCGYVRNVADGRVEMEVEGEKEEIDRFLEEVARQMEGFIRQADVRWEERVRRYKGFEIRP